MNRESLAAKLVRFDERCSNAASRSAAIVQVLFCIALFTYGFELFGFHLTIDEEVHADFVGGIPSWLNQGRWSMAALSFFIPSTVVPTVSPMLGVALSMLGWWLLVAKVLNLGDDKSLWAVALAITVPTYAFSVTFSTLAYGLGVANLCLAAFAYCALKLEIRSLLLASLFGAIAIGIYQTYLFALIPVALVLVYRQPEDAQGAIAKSALAALIGAVIAYLVIDYMARSLFGSDLQYVGKFVDIEGFLGDPLSRIGRAVVNTAAIVFLDARRFGLHSPALLVTCTAVLLALLASHKGQSLRAWLVGTLLLAGVLLTPIAADAIAADGAPMRSVVYYPVIVCLLVALALNRTGAGLRLAICVVTIFAIIGNATIVNRLFGASEIAYEFDKGLARDVLLETRRQNLVSSDFQILKTEVVGSKSWPESRIMPRRETFGASFFEWDAGNRYRVAAFLRLAGVTAIGAGDDLRAKVAGKAMTMPSWPNTGWVAQEQGVLIIKLSDYTTPQKLQLCAAGVVALCK